MITIGQTRDGVIIYRCLRTSSTVEGYHQHLSRCVSACAKHGGTEWLDLLRQKFDFCWTVRSLRRIGWYKGCHHCDIALADRLHSLAQSLGCTLSRSATSASARLASGQSLGCCLALNAAILSASTTCAFFGSSFSACVSATTASPCAPIACSARPLRK